MQTSDSALVRPAQVRDADTLFELLLAFATSYHPSRAAFERNLPKLIGSPESDLLVAEQEGAVVGYALAFDLLTLFANGTVTELQELMVAERWRRQGHGRSLVAAVIQRARGRGAVEVTVPTRRAADFYLRAGFVETAQYFKLPIQAD
jgi:N-acetylglutamate synthase-like GNAT family acetyltransferase